MIIVTNCCKAFIFVQKIQFLNNFKFNVVNLNFLEFFKYLNSMNFRDKIVIFTFFIFWRENSNCNKNNASE